MCGNLANRPLSPLYEQLIYNGVSLSEQGISPLNSSGQLLSGRYEIDANVSSQFISGLLFSLPLLSGDSEIILIGEVQSEKYIELTIQVLEQFSIKITKEKGRYIIKGNQRYIAGESEYIAEGDWSNASSWLCAGAMLEGGILATNLNLCSVQPDRKIIDFLSMCGADVKLMTDGIFVSKGNTQTTNNLIIIDAGQTPDIIPVLSVVACSRCGETRIVNATRLRIKESDRLSAINDVLSNLGADVTENEDGLIIYGNGRLKGGTVHSHNDHRIVMMSAIASIICDSPVHIIGYEAIDKSYPNFFDDLTKLKVKVYFEVN